MINQSKCTCIPIQKHVPCTFNRVRLQPCASLASDGDAIAAAVTDQIATDERLAATSDVNPRPAIVRHIVVHDLTLAVLLHRNACRSAVAHPRAGAYM